MSARARPVGGLRFDWAFALLSGISVVGLYLDGWSHNNIEDLETFFTPWHAVLYAGFAAVAGVTAYAAVRNRRAGLSWREALPPGYSVAAIGLLIYWLGGIGDMAWHAVFGIEARVEQLLSPSHLSLLLGAALFRIAPLRAAWLRRDDDPDARGWRGLFPAVVATTYILSSFTFFTQYVHPLGLAIPAAQFAPGDAATIKVGGIPVAEYVVGTGIVSVLFQTMIVMSLALLLVRRWGARLPFGTFALMLGLNATLMVFMRGRYLVPEPLPLILAAAAAGLVGDLLIRYARPARDRVLAFRAFSIVLPGVLYALYFVGLWISSTVWWTFPMWAGIILLAAGVGWLVSYIALPTPRRDGVAV